MVVVLGDGEKLNWLQDGSLVMGNLMTAAAALGLGSCWINRAMELFDRPEGKELLKKWGLPETCRGVGNCILGYVEGDLPAPKPRKDGWDPPRVTDTQGGGSIPAALLFCCGSPWRIVCNRFIW